MITAKKASKRLEIRTKKIKREILNNPIFIKLMCILDEKIKTSILIGQNFIKISIKTTEGLSIIENILIRTNYLDYLVEEIEKLGYNVKKEYEITYKEKELCELYISWS